MFCNNCGKELQIGDQFCRGCGQPVGVAPIPSSLNRVSQHVHLLGIFWLVYSILIILVAIVIFAVAQVIFGIVAHSPGAGAPPPAFLHPLLSVVAILVLAKGVAGAATGVGLLQRQPWARVMAIVMAFLSVLNLPFGTALGVYTLWAIALNLNSGNNRSRPIV
jgi:zinc ribbon protein